MSVSAEDDQVSFRDDAVPAKHEQEDYPQSEYSVSTPFTIVWTPLPLLTWILPFIGHTGITE
jgi:hypothetical protein